MPPVEPTDEQRQDIRRLHFNTREGAWMGWLDNAVVKWGPGGWEPLPQTPFLPFDMSPQTTSQHVYLVCEVWYQFDSMHLTVSEWKDGVWCTLRRHQDTRLEAQHLHTAKQELQRALKVKMSRLGVPRAKQAEILQKAMLTLNEIWDKPLGEQDPSSFWEHVLGDLT